MKENRAIEKATLLVIGFFIIYEVITAIFQFIFLIRGELIEIGFDLLFILLLVFYYDIDALILLLELIPFVDILPLFVIYMIYKISTPKRPRRPLLDLIFGPSSDKKAPPLQISPLNMKGQERRVIASKDKIYRANTEKVFCVICMQPLQDMDEIITCDNGHLAHVAHIQPWTAMDRDFCPLCRVKYPKVLIAKIYRKNHAVD